jgi:subtilase family serine protease
MYRIRTFVGGIAAAAAVAGLTIVGAGTQAMAGTSTQAGSGPAYTPIAGSTVPFTGHTKVIGTVAGSTQLSIQVWLKPDVAAAEQYAAAVTTPGSAQYHHYLSPDGYAAEFGATASQASQVGSWLRGAGFTGIKTGANRSYVRATAPASTINATLHTTLDLYQPTTQVNAGGYPLRANSGAISVPDTLSSSVLGVTGLDNVAPVLPMERPSTKPAKELASGSTVKGAAATPAVSSSDPPCSQYYGQNIATGKPEQFGTTSFPSEVCGYSAGQFRAAYGANNTNTGKGQTIALVELGLTQDMFLTLQDYASANGLPAPSTQRYEELSLGQGSACGDPFDVEEQLDVESSYAMAPAANQLVVGGDSCNEGDEGLQGLFDADLAVIDGTNNHPLASVASNSWEGGTEGQAPALTNIEHSYLVQAAAEGVGMYFSSGDGSGVESPSDDPDAIAVGGTTLGIGQTNNRLFETGWSTDIAALNGSSWEDLGEQGAAGGGPSLLWAQPAYQKGVVPASLATAPGDRSGKVRSVPDISADADPFTGMAVGLLDFPSDGSAPTYGETDIGGTSLAAPLVAGIVTAAQQGQAKPFGLINPAIYQLAGTSAVHDALPITSSTPTADKGVWCGADACGLEALTTFDDQSLDMFGYTGQVTLKGYDNMSGIGSPAGQSFITALRAKEK